VHSRALAAFGAFPLSDVIAIGRKHNLPVSELVGPHVLGHGKPVGGVTRTAHEALCYARGSCTSSSASTQRVIRLAPVEQP
jgi:hypothetical protein